MHSYSRLYSYIYIASTHSAIDDVIPEQYLSSYQVVIAVITGSYRYLIIIIAMVRIEIKQQLYAVSLHE